MLAISHDHPLVTCAAFAVQWLDAISRYDLSTVAAMIDENESGTPLDVLFQRVPGVTFCHPDKAEGWSVHFMNNGLEGLSVDFGVPFVERKYREMIARFEFAPTGNQFRVRFLGLKPS